MAGLYQQRGLFTTIIWTILSFRGRLYIVIYRNTVFSHTPAVPVSRNVQSRREGEEMLDEITDCAVSGWLQDVFLKG